jgi:surfeit locus 1 family protein
MRLAAGKRVFTPPAWGVILAVLATGAFLALGNWQLGRAREKQALLAEFEAGGRATIDADGRNLGGLGRYQRVRIGGSYDATRQLLLDNMPSPVDGRPGFRVLTPLRRADGRGWVLVDRGWVPLGPTREDLPDVAVGGEPRRVSGVLDVLPVPGLRAGPAAVPGDSRWPRVMLFPTAADVESALGTAVEARIVLLDDADPDGFERKWRPALGFGPERHLGYAVQWFAFALVAAVLFIALNLRRVNADEDSHPS